MSLSLLLWTLLAVAEGGRYEKGGRSDGSALHEVTLGVRQKPVEELNRLLLEVSTPGLPKFRQHYSFDEVGRLAMDSKDVAAALRWARQKGEVLKRTMRGEFLTVRAPVKVWEDAFDCEFYDYGPLRRCDRDYTLPEAFLGRVFGVSELPPRLKQRRLQKEIVAGNQIDPSVLNAFYEIPSNFGSSKVFQGVFETGDMNYSPSDLRTFNEAFGIIPKEHVITDVGGHADDGACLDPNLCSEGNLDVQYLMGLSQETPTTYYYTDAGSQFLSFATYVANLTTLPFVGSISWGSIESEVSDSVKDAFDTEVIKAGLTGSSFFVSSGDDGVANFAAEGPSDCGYTPSFPASSPYVVSVGATYNKNYKIPGQGEIVCESDKFGAVITSGGGFSTYYKAPDFTGNAVTQYLATTAPVPGYNVTGRAYPDLALSGYAYLVYIGGLLYTVSGTSASAPAVAAMASLVNALRVEAGAEGLGYILPQLYGTGLAVTNDVTEGNNNCVAQNAFCCDQGFPASPGWDPATGFGSLDYTRFEAAFTADIDVAALTAAKRRLLERRRDILTVFDAPAPSSDHLAAV